MDLSIPRLFVSKKSKHTLITPHGIGYSVWSSFTRSLLRLSRTVHVDTYHWSVLSVFIQTSSLHLELLFIAFTKKIACLVFQVCVLLYIQVEMAFLAIVLYATTGWFMLLIFNVFKWFSSQVFLKNTVINLFSPSFRVTRFKNNVLNTELLTLNIWPCLTLFFIV